MEAVKAYYDGQVFTPEGPVKLTSDQGSANTTEILSFAADEREQGAVLSAESFGMWADRQDMDDVESYVRNLRRGRKLC
ncbi:hypothetical protein AGMMS49944_27250 [Spirochaetia bacterium]|nr:hypothetical protein AGMMS49944_27250 [Spirochaetia bacterium]